MYNYGRATICYTLTIRIQCENIFTEHFVFIKLIEVKTHTHASNMNVGRQSVKSKSIFLG